MFVPIAQAPTPACWQTHVGFGLLPGQWYRAAILSGVSRRRGMRARDVRDASKTMFRAREKIPRRRLPAARVHPPPVRALTMAFPLSLTHPPPRPHSPASVPRLSPSRSQARAAFVCAAGKSAECAAGHSDVRFPVTLWGRRGRRICPKKRRPARRRGGGW